MKNFRIFIAVFIVMMALNPIRNLSQIQSDTSDTYWSVVIPIIASQNIDMKQCLINKSKDSVVKRFVTNAGSCGFTVDSIYFTGTDADAFQLVSGFPKYDLAVGADKSTEFRFKPTKIGIHNATIVIITQNDTLKQTITGEGVTPKLALITTILDFGQVKLGNDSTIKDTVLIKNVSSSPMTINNVIQLGPDKEQFEIINGGGSFTLQPNETRKLSIMFKPVFEGRTSGQLGFEYNGTSSPAKVQLFGQGLKIFPKITTNSPICDGDDLLLFADSIANATYHWYGPDGFKSNQQNPILEKAKLTQSGKYYLYATVGNINSDTLSIDILINSFLVSPGDSSLIFVGTAAKINDYIKLTEPKIWDGGSIWLKNRFSVKRDFATTFKFRTRYGDDRVTPDGSLPGADGFAFVMQNHNYPILGVKGGSMGYTGITNSLAIEFDLYKNPWDPNGNHIAVQSMGAEANQPDHTKYNSCMGITSNIITIKQDSLYFAKIEYDWATKNLKIYLDSTGKFESTALSIPNIDLASYLQLEEGEYVYIGFTAGTGESYQEHDLFDWTIPCKNQLVDVEDNKTINNIDDELVITPNPASHDAVISYNLDIESNVSLLIINAYGQEISKPISNKFHCTGNFSYNFETSSLSEGVYFVILQKGNERVSKLFLVIK